MSRFGKGQVIILETISSIVALLVAFFVLFPSFRHSTLWEKSLLLLKERDFLASLERMGKLYEIVFCNFQEFKRYFDFAVGSEFIPTIVTEGTLKPKITVAANCTEDEINTLYEWFRDLKVNRRNITVLFVYSNLDEINKYPSDVLLICGDKNLSSYSSEIEKYLNSGRGVVYLADILELDDAEKKIFGIEEYTGSVAKKFKDVVFRKPLGNQTAYEVYKYFFSFPLSVFYTSNVSSSKEIYRGELKIREKPYTFEIYPQRDLVFFDTDGDGMLDKWISEREFFKLKEGNKNFTFMLNYLEKYDIKISFREVFNFTNFSCETCIQLKSIEPSNILLFSGFYDDGSLIPVATINGSYFSKAIWVQDFRDQPIVGEDYKSLLLSSLLSASSKISNIPQKYIYTQYLGVEKYDMFEVYKIYFGILSPY